MNRKLKAAFRVIAMTLVLFITVQIIPTHAYAAEGSSTGIKLPKQQELLIPADYKRVLDEGYQSYTMDAGRGGTFLLNTESVSWRLTRKDIGFSGSRMGASISWIYRGSSWQLNYNQQIKYTKAALFQPAYYTMEDSNSTIKFNDDTGTENGTQIWQSKKTPGAVLHVKESGYTVIKANAQYDYNQSGKITAVTNLENNDRVQILYRSDGNYDKVIDAIGREYRFTYKMINGILSVAAITAYNRDGEIIRVDGAEGTVQYGYEKIGEENLMKTVLYPDGKQASYQYNDNGYIRRIDGISKQVEITYDGNAFASISDGEKAMSYSLIRSNVVNMRCFADNYGNVDRVPVRLLEKYPFAVYDKDWHTVYTKASGDWIINGNFYDYANIGLDEAEYDASWCDAWKVYGDEEAPLPYASGGGVVLDGKTSIYQTLNIDIEKSRYVIIGLACSKVGGNGIKLSIGSSEPIITLTAPCMIYILYNLSETQRRIMISGTGVVTKVFLHTTLTPAREEEKDYCPCSNCETLNCPCRCKSEAECNCAECVSRISETKDAYGNLLTASRTADGKTLKSTNTYTPNGDFPSTATDANGIRADYHYNQDNGLLESESNAKGASLNYSYDAVGALKSVQAQVNGKTMLNQYTYLNDRLASISHNGFAYYFDYDKGGNLLNTKVNNNVLASYKYENNDVKEISFANGQKVRYQYKNHLITGIDIDNDGEMEYTYTYNRKNELDTAYDYINYSKTVVKNGNAVTSTTYGEKIFYATFKGEDKNKFTETVNNEQLTYQTHQSQAENGAITSSVKITNNNLGISITNTEDALKRLGTNKVTLNGTNTALTTNYAYKDRGSLTGTQVEQVQTAIRKSGGGTGTVRFGYTYDAVGNVSSESRETGSKWNTVYSYDGVNQLISETNSQFGERCYSYDAAGNMLQKTIVDPETGQTATVDYAYDSKWKDLLVEYDGQPIYHDALGNVTEDSQYTYTWSAGRQLARIQGKPGGAMQEANFAYDANGLRSQKFIVTDYGPYHTYYVWANGCLAGIEVYSLTGKNNLRFLYANGSPVGFILNEATPYFYVKNLMGDICEVVDKDGKTVASYYYDAWGNLLKSEGDEEIIRLNPLTYRGYLYDSETGLYYLQTRYYNPQWNRFLNADTNMDTQTSIVGTNIFSYCDNDPVNYHDSNGQIKKYSLAWPGEIHNAVVDNIAGKLNVLSEVTIQLTTGKRGRADLVNELTGEIWEVKPISYAWFNSEAKWNKAIKQINGYITGTTSKIPVGIKSQVGGYISPDSFKYKTYEVNYLYAGNGIILYEFHNVGEKINIDGFQTWSEFITTVVFFVCLIVFIISAVMGMPVNPPQVPGFA